MSKIHRSLENEVRRRALDRCEYCCMPQVYYRTPFPLDHIIARQHSGQSTSDNLAVACFHCNLHKGPNIAGLDPDSGRLTRLYHPRTDRWSDHFQWQQALVVGFTPIGRATISVLAMNHPEPVEVRKSLIEAGLLPALETLE